MPETREQVRSDLRVYMMKTGMELNEIAEFVGYSGQTLRQYASRGQFGDAEETGKTTQKIAAWMRDNPAQLPEFPGTLYETAGTRLMRETITEAREEAVWGTVYAPYGGQKIFLFQTVLAESAREEGPDANWFALVETFERMTPHQLLKQIARAIAAPYAQFTARLREAILWTLRRRRSPIVVVIDEGQLLYSMIDTLECLRRLADLSRGRMGVIVAGNEQVLKLFSARRNTSMGQWRSRVEQRRVRVFGPTQAEGRKIARAEIPGLTDSQIDRLIEGSMDDDPLPDDRGRKLRYVNLRRLFNAMRDYRRRARKAN